MRTRFALAGAASCVMLTGFALAQAAEDGVTTSVPSALLAEADAQWNMLETYCVSCHNTEDWAGSIAFDTMRPDHIATDAETWESVLRKLHGRLMPPPGQDQPEQARVDGFVRWLETSLDSASASPRAGHVMAQRLNRAQYATAVKGLLGVEVDAESILPTEVEVEGFDNIAAALGVSPAFLEQYISAARLVARLAVGDRTAQTASAFYPAPADYEANHVDGLPLGTRGGFAFDHFFPADGEYQVNILDFDIGLYPHTLENRNTLLVFVDGREVFRGDVGGEEDLAMVDREAVLGRAAVLERFANIPMNVTAGLHKVGITFQERSHALSEYQANLPPTGNFVAGRNRLPHVTNGVEVVGPFNPTGVSMTPSRKQLFVCVPETAADEQACARDIISNLARRAFRRPLAEADLELLMPFYDSGRASGGSFDAGIELAVAAVLVSPDFLYRTVTSSDDSAVFPLDDLELASRLSFFLWSQGPDDALIEVAAAGKLSDPKVMEEQVRRMLADPRAQVLVSDFALKWLNLDKLDDVKPVAQAFPEFNAQLRGDFETEVRLFLASVLLEERSVLELLDARHTFLNESLAIHYGIKGLRGDQFRRVELEDETRRGLLGKSAVLLRTSYGDRTSPVLRGAWILDKLLGTPPAPPPPNAETDLSVPEGERPTTVRARLEEHRANPSCGACHGVIDPWGLALENFDVTGHWREVDAASGDAIDPTTVLASGAAIAGPAQLREELLRQSDQFVQNLTAKLMMYALGRELEYYDMPQVRAIVRAAQEDGYTLSALVLGIVESDAFRLQATPQAQEEQVAARAQ